MSAMFSKCSLNSSRMFASCSKCSLDRSRRFASGSRCSVNSSRRFAGSSRCSFSNSSRSRICGPVGRVNCHDVSAACLAREVLRCRKLDVPVSGSCNSNSSSIGSSKDRRAIAFNSGSDSSNSENPSSSTGSSSANSSVTSSRAGNSANCSEARDVGLRSSSTPCCREATGSCNTTGSRVRVGATSLSSWHCCHSCFTTLSCSFGIARIAGACRGTCTHRSTVRKKNNAISTPTSRGSRCTSPISSSKAESSRGDHGVCSSSKGSSSSDGGYGPITDDACPRRCCMRFASAGVWGESSNKTRGGDETATEHFKLIEIATSNKNSSKAEDDTHVSSVAGDGSSRSLFTHTSSSAVVSTGSLCHVDKREGEQTSNKVRTKRHLQHQEAALECGGDRSSRTSNTETGERTLHVRRGRSNLLISSFSRSVTSWMNARGGSFDIPKLMRTPVFSFHSPALFASPFSSCDSIYFLSSCPSYPSPSTSTSSCPPLSSLPLCPSSCVSSSLFSSWSPSCSLSSSWSCASLLFHSFICTSSFAASNRFPPASSSSVLVSSGRRFSTAGSGRRGYLFDPIADAPETEPQAVAKLDELAMVQLKTVLLPSDLRQRLEQLLLHAGRKQDIEKIGKLLMAKYTARTSVELPRVLPSQLFASAAAAARSCDAGKEGEEDDHAAAATGSGEREKEVGRRKEGLSSSSEEEARLQQEALALAEDQRHRLFRKLAGSHSPLTAAAYTAHRYAGVYSSMLRILQEIKVRAPDFLPEHVLEMHAGFAAGLAAAARVWALPQSAGQAIVGQSAAEPRSDSDGNSCPAAAAWWVATATASAPLAAAGEFSSNESDGRSERQHQAYTSSSREHQGQQQGRRSVFKFLLAVERSSHLMTVGKFLTADLYPPVQWQMGLYEEGLGFVAEEAAAAAIQQEEAKRREVQLTAAAAGKGEADITCRLARARSAAAAATQTSAAESAVCSSSCWPQPPNPSSLKGGMETGQQRRRRFDLIMLPHCLLSIADGWESMQQQVRSLWNRLAHGGVLVLLERGTPTGFRALHAIREMFIRELGVGKFHFVSPCPHESICPLALTGRDWCHFSQRVHRLPHHLYCKGSRAKNIEEEKFSFLVIRKMPGPRSRYTCEAECRTPEERSYFWPRVVMPVIKGGQHCLLDLCAAPHTFERVAVSKSMPHTAGYKCARKAHWGDLWRYPRRIIRPEARGYTDEEIRKHLLRLHRKTQQRDTGCQTQAPSAAAADLEEQLKASFGG